VSNRSVPQNVLPTLCLALAIGNGSCGQAPKPADSPAAAGRPRLTTRIPPDCHVDAPSACRVGCDADVPPKVIDVAPDLAGLDVTDLNGVDILEILIDVRGSVREACLLRGVREDVDDRAIGAVRRWRFQPARLRHSTPPGLPVPIVMTVTLRIGARL
jgi:hypothetical protein